LKLLKIIKSQKILEVQNRNDFVKELKCNIHFNSNKWRIESIPILNISNHEFEACIDNTNHNQQLNQENNLLHNNFHHLNQKALQSVTPKVKCRIFEQRLKLKIFSKWKSYLALSKKIDLLVDKDLNLGENLKLKSKK